MFNLERGLRYWLYSVPTDMRKSFHTLSGLVWNKIGGDPMNGDVYIFVNKRRNRIKLLHYETGVQGSKSVSVVWEIEGGKIIMKNDADSLKPMLLECKDVPWEPLGEADILKFDNYKIS